MLIISDKSKEKFGRCKGCQSAWKDCNWTDILVLLRVFTLVVLIGYWLFYVIFKHFCFKQETSIKTFFNRLKMIIYSSLIRSNQTWLFCRTRIRKNSFSELELELDYWLFPLSRVNFFFRVTMVTIAIMFHNPILILTLWASLLRFWIPVYRQA